MPTVLVVEDEHPYLFKQALELIGYEVLIATRGDTAVELARAPICDDCGHPWATEQGSCPECGGESHRQIDAIIMDLRLPGLSGIEAIQAIREFNPIVPIFAVTAYTDAHTRQAAINAGANLYQAKPVDFKILLSQLEQALQG